MTAYAAGCTLTGPASGCSPPRTGFTPRSARGLRLPRPGLLTDHACHCVPNAAWACDAGSEAALIEVAATIRNVVRL